MAEPSGGLVSPESQAKVKAFLTKKWGPLPAWAWLTIAAIGIYVYRNRNVVAGEGEGDVYQDDPFATGEDFGEPAFVGGGVGGPPVYEIPPAEEAPPSSEGPADDGGLTGPQEKRLRRRVSKLERQRRREREKRRKAQARRRRRQRQGKREKGRRRPHGGRRPSPADWRAARRIGSIPGRRGPRGIPGWPQGGIPGRHGGRDRSPGHGFPRRPSVGGGKPKSPVRRGGPVRHRAARVPVRRRARAPRARR